MSTRQNVGYGFARSGFVGHVHALALAAAVATTGCATTGGALDHAEAAATGVTMAQGTRGMESTGLRAGDTHVIAGHVNPMVSVRLTVDGDDVAVRFAHPRAGGALVHLDRASLAPTSAETAVPAERASTPSGEAVRTVLADGKFIVCWKSGTPEAGYRVMAQAWTAGGDRLGTPVVVSSPEVDVLGAPQVIALDGDRAVATFAAMTGDRAELVAVSLEVL